MGVVLCDSQDGWEQKTQVPKQVTRVEPQIPCISRRQACMVGKGKFASLWRKRSGGMAKLASRRPTWKLQNWMGSLQHSQGSTSARAELWPCLPILTGRTL